jgi:restriction system protein
MTIPTSEQILTPLLNIMKDRQVHNRKEILEELGVIINIAFEERKIRKASGKQTIFENRVDWAITYLKKAKIISNLSRGQYKITSRGEEILKMNPDNINVKYLENYPEFIEFQTRYFFYP